MLRMGEMRYYLFFLKLHPPYPCERQRTGWEQGHFKTKKKDCLVVSGGVKRNPVLKEFFFCP
ncbi:hypothetical protein ASZ90_015179 [hydrocarbon metagenome]|uniref:Uncharacterized protein n=1 Tax=hydrocarbon metagenome TaxID=938273 RepID=A0A0W8F3N3_9ZZZZ